MTTIPITSPYSFLRSIVQIQGNRNYLLLGLGISILSFVLFKLLYPYPDFLSDSYSYLEAAHLNLGISIWPIGYSKVLWAFHHLTYSDTAFVGFQYLFLQVSSLYFFFTVRYLYQPSKVTQKLLFAFLFINPLSLYLSNTINSDALFAALSILWFSQLLWMIQRPKVYQLFVQAILLFLCFTIRNNAYYYPLIAIFSFLLSKQPLRWKLAGIIMPFLLIIPFVIHTRNEAFKITGTRQFSLFTGWQLANNALYIYDQIEVDSAGLPNAQAKDLNREAIAFFKKVNPAVYRDFLESYVGNFFIKQPDAPLKQYCGHHYTKEASGIAAWGKASADFEPFGKYVIMHNPVTYARYFMLPNAWHYIMPPLSHLEQYNYGADTIAVIGKVWFHYPSVRVHVWSHGFQGFLLVYTALFLVFNLYYLWYLVAYLRKKGFSWKVQGERSAFQLTALFLLFNFGFSIFATVNILRYQYVPMIALLSFSLLMSDYLERLAAEAKGKSKKFTPNSENSALYRIHKQPIQ